MGVGGKVAQLWKRESLGASSTQRVPSSRFRAFSPPSCLTSRGSETDHVPALPRPGTFVARAPLWPNASGDHMFSEALRSLGQSRAASAHNT